MSKSTIDKMVNRFLAWKLPSDFWPDAFISFDKVRAAANNCQPIGTNLLTAEQARAMFEHCISEEAHSVEPVVGAPFAQECRYIVLKGADLQGLHPHYWTQLSDIMKYHDRNRRFKGKPPLECVVVESDWPEYTPTWDAIKARVNAGAHHTPPPSSELVK